MGQMGNYKHSSEEAVASVTAINALTMLRKAITLPQKTLIQSSVFINVTDILGGSTKITMRITSDAAGDISLVPDTEADISLGLTTATSGSVVYKTDIVVPSPGTTIYVWAKLDAGTANWQTVSVTGLE